MLNATIFTHLCGIFHEGLCVCDGKCQVMICHRFAAIDVEDRDLWQCTAVL